MDEWLKLSGPCQPAGRKSVRLDEFAVSRPESPQRQRDGGCRAAAVMAAAASVGRMNAPELPHTQSLPPGYERWPAEANGPPLSPFAFTGTDAAVMPASQHSMHSTGAEAQGAAAVSALQDGNAATQQMLWFPKTLAGYVSQASFIRSAPYQSYPSSNPENAIENSIAWDSPVGSRFYVPVLGNGISMCKSRV